MATPNRPDSQDEIARRDQEESDWDWKRHCTDKHWYCRTCCTMVENKDECCSLDGSPRPHWLENRRKRK